MSQIKPEIETFARIKVVGVGGGGGNAVSRMVESKIKGVDFIAVNTDAQDLHHSAAKTKIHIGKNTTKGLGAGMNPDVGRQAAEESREEIQEALKGSDLVFVTCGMGGGTGTGASPVVAEIAKNIGALTIGVVTKPFSFEGIQRSRLATDGVENLKEKVDALVVIPNDRIFNIIEKKTSIMGSFALVDDVLQNAVQGISDLITLPGIINVDFADIRAIMQDAGSALMGIGVASGDDRAIEAARAAISSPLLEISIEGAKGVLFSVSGGADMGMMEINDAAKVISEYVDPNAKIIFGALIDQRLKKGEIKVTVIATGFGEEISRKLVETIKVPNFQEIRDRRNPELITSQFSESQIVKESSHNIEEVIMVKTATQNNSNNIITDSKQVKEDVIEKREETPKKKLFSSESIFNTNDEWDVPAFIRRKK
ncbi:MAG: cell division protein FtsZ [Patescibacteria group bacterium]